VTVTYADTLTVEQAVSLFPEIDASKITRADRLLDLDVGGLGCFPDQSFDFVIISHVLEHLANPIRVVGDVFRVLRPGGRAVIAVPDMRFTFDKTRKLTPFAHLLRDYRDGVTANSDDHYLDFLGGVAPEILAGPPENIPIHVARVRARREHCHVWNSETFRDFLVRSVELSGVAARPLYESGGDQNSWEYFGVCERA
jgi:SAM-dependent methyltransferase